MNIHLSKSFYACPPPTPPIPLYFASRGLDCKSGSVVFGRTCFVLQLPADSSLSTPTPPPDQFTDSMFRQHAALAKQTAHHAQCCAQVFAAAVPVMTYNNNGNNSASTKVGQHYSCQHSSTTPPPEQAGGLPGHK